ncbi:hypothetical protein JTB14_002805, partial [Gonioctena quinquepunctata]
STNVGLKLFEEYGPKFRFFLGPFRPVLVVADGKLLKFILSSPKFITKPKEYNVFCNWLGFGLFTSNDWENLLNTTLEQLNIIFGCKLDERDINNIHLIGKKNTIIVEFISNLQKQKIFKHLYKLKGTGISITHDLRPEDRELNRNLVHHLKEARAKNQKAHIKNFKLFVNAVPYTIEELENPTDSLNTELESSLPKIQPKNKSAPSIPTTTHHSSKELEDTPSISEIPDVTEPQLKKQTTRTEILKHHIHENTESKSPITTKLSTNNPNRNQPMKMKEIKETRSLRNKQTIN